VKEKAACRSGGIDPVSQADELHITSLKIAHELDELANRSAKPINFPNYKRIARAQMRLRFFQARTITTPSA